MKSGKIIPYEEMAKGTQPKTIKVKFVNKGQAVPSHLKDLDTRQPDTELVEAITLLKKTTGFIPASKLKKKVMDFIEEQE
jgi:hypothetical protein